MTFAARTRVPIEHTRNEIERALTRYGAWLPVEARQRRDRFRERVRRSERADDPFDRRLRKATSEIPHQHYGQDGQQRHDQQADGLQHNLIQ
jgi:hypothetical protein